MAPTTSGAIPSNGSNTVQSTTTLSKAELRKNNKPIMEKRRRARINHCLNELKTLILEALKKDPARHTKLEKADILEMTVKYLQSLQRQNSMSSINVPTPTFRPNSTVFQKFKTGFNECAEEIGRFVNSMDDIDPIVKQRLINHMSNCVNGLQQISSSNAFLSPISNLYSNSSPSNGSMMHLPIINSKPSSINGSQFLSGDVNNNGNMVNARIHLPNGLQLIPSRLSTGELALLVPNSNNVPYLSSTSLLKIDTSQVIVDSSSQTLYEKNSQLEKPMQYDKSINNHFDKLNINPTISNQNNLNQTNLSQTSLNQISLNQNNLNQINLNQIDKFSNNIRFEKNNPIKLISHESAFSEIKQRSLSPTKSRSTPPLSPASSTSFQKPDSVIWNHQQPQISSSTSDFQKFHGEDFQKINGDEFQKLNGEKTTIHEMKLNNPLDGKCEPDIQTSFVPLKKRYHERLDIEIPSKISKITNEIVTSSQNHTDVRQSSSSPESSVNHSSDSSFENSSVNTSGSSSSGNSADSMWRPW